LEDVACKGGRDSLESEKNTKKKEKGSARDYGPIKGEDGFGTEEGSEHRVGKPRRIPGCDPLQEIRKNYKTSGNPARTQKGMDGRNSLTSPEKPVAPPTEVT